MKIRDEETSDEWRDEEMKRPVRKWRKSEMKRQMKRWRDC